MTLKIAAIIDPLSSLNFKKDSTIALLMEAQSRSYEIFGIEQGDLFYENNLAQAKSKKIQLKNDPHDWVTITNQAVHPLTHFDIILMRKDPPFNLEYIYTTYLLENAEAQGVRVINKPQSLRDANEKFFTTRFSELCPPTLVTRDIALAKQFYEEHHDVVCKPLDAMGGASILHLKYPDENASVAFEMISYNGTRMMVVQKYIPEIKKGDKRILMIDGKPISHALARVPAQGELRGNLVAGATGVVQPLSERDKFICSKVGPTLRDKGLYFVGLDIIGDFLTEINVTSPTCIREIDAQAGTNIAGQFWDSLKL